MEGVSVKRKKNCDTKGTRNVRNTRNTRSKNSLQNSELSSSWESNICGKCLQSTNYTRWIQCDDCSRWYHCNCVRIYDEEIIENYYCSSCCAGQGRLKEYGEYTLQRITNNYRYNPMETIVKNKNQDKIQIGTAGFIEKLKKWSEEKKFSEPILGTDIFVLKNGHDLEKHLKKNGFYAPIVVKNPDGLNMKVPKNFSVHDLRKHLGPLFPIDVVNVHKQIVNAMTLQEFIELLEFSEIPYDSISLELSKTSLSTKIDPPRAVRNYSWAEEAYEQAPALKKYRPAVDKFCLISMTDSYTDFQIEFSGSSTWYHVIRGKKKFFFVKPTEENLAIYKYLETNDAKNQEVFFPEAIKDKTYEIELREGDSLLLPTGYIRGVLTYEPSLLFGGNFLHSLQADMQIQIYRMEEELKVEESVRYLNFRLTHWLAIPKVLNELEQALPVLTKENCASNPRYESLHRSFQSFVQYSLDYHVKLIAWKKATCKRANNDLSEEELNEWNVTLSDQYLNSLNKMKQILDNIGFEQSDESAGQIDVGSLKRRLTIKDAKQTKSLRTRWSSRRLADKRDAENRKNHVDQSDTSELDQFAEMETSNVKLVRTSSLGSSILMPKSSATSSNGIGTTDHLSPVVVASDSAAQADDGDALASKSSGMDQHKVTDLNNDLNMIFASSSVQFLNLAYEHEYRLILDRVSDRVPTPFVAVEPEIECITIDD